MMYGKFAIPKTLSAAFPDLEIRNGVLLPHNGSPYSPPAYLISPVINQFFNQSTMLSHKAESLVVIDTATSSSVNKKKTKALMNANSLVFFYNEKNEFEIPYEYLLSGKKDFHFTQDAILTHLKKHSIQIFIGYLFSTIIHDGVMFLFSIFFLAFAAFIFRIDRQRRFKEFLKVAVFAISPIVLGGLLVSVSGVKIQWIWHILIFLSTVVMFRAIIALSNGFPSSGENT